MQERGVSMKGTGRISEKSRNIVGQDRTSTLFLGILLVFLCGILWSVPQRAEAAGATISITTKNSTVMEGDTVYVVITVRSSEVIKGFQGYFSYDNRILQFVTGGSVVHGNDDAFQIDDTSRSASASKIIYSVKFLARKAGNTAISLKKPYEVTADDDNASKMSVSYNALNVVVKEPGSESSTKPPQKTEAPEKSAAPEETKKPEQSSPEPTRSKEDIAGSNKLRSLSVEGVELAPDFSPEIKNYSGIVTTDETTLFISWEAEDSLAEVKVKGNKRLTEGKNIIKIAVTGTNGKKKVYRLSVTIQKPTGANSKNSTNMVTVSQKEGETYAIGSMKVQLLEPDKDSIPSGFAETEIEIDGKMITAYALESSTESNFVLLYGKGSKKEFYLYDKKENILMPYEKVKSWYRSMDGEAVLETTVQERTIQSLKYTIGIMAAFCGLMILIVIAVLLHARNRRNR